MSRIVPSSESRREFLKDAALVSAALAGWSLPAATLGQTGGKPPSIGGSPAELKLGLAPDPKAHGAIVLQSSWATYATFRAMAADESGGLRPGGTGIVELLGHQVKHFSYSTDDGLDGRPYSYFDLKPGAIFEITGSPWLAQVDEAVRYAAAGTNAKRQPLRHFVFTFNSTTFQCIAEGLRAKLSSAPFRFIAADLRLGD